MRRTKTTRTVDLTIERSEFSLVAKSREPALEWCNRCGRRVPFVTPAEAGRVAGASTREVYRWVEAADIHFLDKPDGRLLVCLDSLAPLR